MQLLQDSHVLQSLLNSCRCMRINAPCDKNSLCAMTEITAWQHLLMIACFFWSYVQNTRAVFWTADYLTTQLLGQNGSYYPPVPALMTNSFSLVSLSPCFAVPICRSLLSWFEQPRFHSGCRWMYSQCTSITILNSTKCVMTASHPLHCLLFTPCNLLHLPSHEMTVIGILHMA